MLRTRIVSAAILIPIIGAAVYFGGGFYVGLVLVAGLLAGWEYFALVRRSGAATSPAIGLGLVVLLLIDAHWPALNARAWAPLLAVLAALTVHIFRANGPGSLSGWGLTVAGGSYLGYALAQFIRLRNGPDGAAWIALAFVGTWITDTGAYFVGRAVGRQPFFAHISPKKTLEGAIGGLVTGVIAVMALGAWWINLPAVNGLVLGVLLALAATFGDLAESVLKRQVGVKDSGNLIPGHGGMLDRVDSLLFVVPVVYYFTVALGINAP
ncbi:MAG TPA: phosphatidate cytidylyltransferase [Chloroflexi bacterium]|jgi:phosphatidate cytidylyltransferase|nr:phosphatidate cytidylyltransferase [Chloroflexota bacterium]